MYSTYRFTLHMSGVGLLAFFLTAQTAFGQLRQHLSDGPYTTPNRSLPSHGLGRAGVGDRGAIIVIPPLGQPSAGAWTLQDESNGDLILQLPNGSENNPVSLHGICQKTPCLSQCSLVGYRCLE